MSTEGSETNLVSSSEDNVSEDLQSRENVVTVSVEEDTSSTGSVAPKSISAGEALVLDETTSENTTAADNQILKESTSAEPNLTKESTSIIESSANEESGDSVTSSVKTQSQRVRRVSFAEGVRVDNGETAATGTSEDLAVSTRGTGDGASEDRPDSTDTVNYLCCPEHRGVIGYLRIKLMYFRVSKYFLMLQFFLLAMPLALGFLGGKYMYLCDASPAVPILFFMMGIIGTVFLFGRIYTGFKKLLFPRSGWEDPSEGLPIAGLLLLSILFGTELFCFFKMDPEFTHIRASHKFCDPDFYYFATWMNYLGIVILVILILFQLPCINPNNLTRITA